jgi:hypothetical protein
MRGSQPNHSAVQLLGHLHYQDLRRSHAAADPAANARADARAPTAADRRARIAITDPLAIHPPVRCVPSRVDIALAVQLP